MKPGRSAQMTACIIGTLTLIACGKNGSDGSDGLKGETGAKGEQGEVAEANANPLNGIFVGRNILKMDDQRYHLYRTVDNSAIVEYGQTFQSGSSLIFEPKGYKCLQDDKEAHYSKEQFTLASTDNKALALETVEKEQANLEAEKDKLPDVISATESELTLLSEEIEALQTRMEEIQTPIKNVQTEIQTLNDTIEKADAKTETLNKNISDIVAKLKLLGTSLANATPEQVNQISAEINQQTSQKESLEAELKENMTQLEQSIATKAAKEKEIEEFTTNLTQITEKKDEKLAAKQEKETQKAESTERLAALPKLIEERAKQYAAIESALPYATTDQILQPRFELDQKVLNLSGKPMLRAKTLPALPLASCESFHKQYYLQLTPVAVTNSEEPTSGESETSNETEPDSN